jgi:hypothetical protein
MVSLFLWYLFINFVDDFLFKIYDPIRSRKYSHVVPWIGCSAD